MPNVTISQLPSSGILTATDVLPAVASNVTSKVTVQELAESLFPNDIWFVVNAGGDLNVNDGDNVITLPTEFIGRRIRIYRNNILLDNGSMDGFSDSYFTYTVGDNTFELSQSTVGDEKFVITAY